MRNGSEYVYRIDKNQKHSRQNTREHKIRKCLKNPDHGILQKFHVHDHPIDCLKKQTGHGTGNVQRPSRRPSPQKADAPDSTHAKHFRHMDLLLFPGGFHTSEQRTDFKQDQQHHQQKPQQDERIVSG